MPLFLKNPKIFKDDMEVKDLKTLTALKTFKIEGDLRARGIFINFARFSDRKPRSL